MQEAAKRCSRENGGPLKIGYVGRLEQYQKRVPDLVPIAARLNSKGVAFELHLVGDGSIRRRLEAQFQKQGLRELVRFWGWLAPIQVRERLANLDVFVLPSDHEGLPVALLEAMSQVVAPLVTNIASGNTELVSEGENGHLLEVGDIDGFVGRLETLARKPGALEATKARRLGDEPPIRDRSHGRKLRRVYPTNNHFQTKPGAIPPARVIPGHALLSIELPELAPKDQVGACGSLNQWN